MTWLSNRHPEYDAALPRWKFTRDLYSGDFLCHTAQTPSTLAPITAYLVKKATAETEEAYRERAQLADYTPHFPAIVDSLAGMLFASEGDKNEQFTDDDGTGLGAKDDPATPIGRLALDVDGHGTGYDTLWKRLATELVLTHAHWVLVDSLDGEPIVRLLPPESVPNWVEGADGGMRDVLVVEDVDGRDSLEDPQGTVTRYLRYTLEGWTRYELRRGTGSEPDTVVPVEGEDGSGTYSYVNARQQPTLPIFRVMLPLSRPVGYLIARKANAIFNRESERDHLLRTANFPKLLLDVVDDAQYDNVVGKIVAGFNVLPGAGHVFIAPDTGPASIATEVLKRKVEELYVTAFREYGDAAVQKTATEVRQDISSGVGAFLHLLKAAVDDAENRVLSLIAQTLFPGKSELWFAAHVERSDTFLPSDVNAEIERLRGWLFGVQANIPIGKTAQVQAAKELAGWMGTQPDDAELESAVDLANLKNALDVLVSAGLPVPSDAKAVLTGNLLEALGVKVTPAMLLEIAGMAANDAAIQQQQADFFRAQAPTDPATDPTADPNATPAPMQQAVGSDMPAVNVNVTPMQTQRLRIVRGGDGKISEIVKD